MLTTLGGVAAARRQRLAWYGVFQGDGSASLALWRGVWAVWGNGNGNIPFDDPGTANGANPTSYTFNGIPVTALPAEATVVEMSVTSRRVAMILCDLLWTGPISTLTSGVPAAYTPPTLPARDLNGATAGEGCVAVVWATGSNVTYTVSYTNSAGTSGRTGTVVTGGGSAGGPYPVALQAGDKGVRSIESLTTSANATCSVSIIRRVAHHRPSMVNAAPTPLVPGESSMLQNLSRIPSGALLFPLFLGLSAGTAGGGGAVTLAVDD